MDGKGYGMVRVNGRSEKTHRLAYRLFVGPLKKGYQICHRCDVPACMNPEHLFQGTNSDNQRDCVAKGRNFNKKKLACLRGHSLVGTNLYSRKDGTRECKECRRENVRRFRLVNEGRARRGVPG